MVQVGAGRDIIVIGASMGGIEALGILLGSLPPDLPAAIFIVQHLSPESPSLLAQVLSRESQLPVATAIEGEPIVIGRVVLAPPDYHLLVERGRMRVVRGPIENRHRPAVDPLFRSAALAYGPRVAGVILTGSLDDGVAGLRAVKAAGGLAIVQDPEECVAPSMPASAIARVPVDLVLPLAEIGKALVRHCGAADGAPAPDAQLELETRMDSGQHVRADEAARLGSVSIFTCPECHGPLWEMPDGELKRYRCFVGHAYSQQHLEEGQLQQRERSLWIALHAVQEQAEWYRRMARRYHDSGLAGLVPRYEDKALARERDAQVIRALIDPTSGSQD